MITCLLDSSLEKDDDVFMVSRIIWINSLSKLENIMQYLSVSASPLWCSAMVHLQLTSSLFVF